MPAVIVEPDFIDSNDRVLFDTVEEQKAIGRSIAHGILKHLGIKIKDSSIATKPKEEPTVEQYKKDVAASPCFREAQKWVKETKTPDGGSISDLSQEKKFG
ncbi:hypothetical protein CD798_18210 [Bacillaceae bacterium SAOS 7]|nr:hypothetical protein CD798_18210 [Bacillaceae bacterium SAOS 7]